MPGVLFRRDKDGSEVVVAVVNTVYMAERLLENVVGNPQYAYRVSEIPQATFARVIQELSK
jgi:hypothetical protein